MKKLIKLFRKKSFFKKGKIISNIFPFVLICLVVLAFFWKFFFKGLIPIPADITTGMYFPWLDYKWGYAVGVPVKNPILSDVVSVIYPLKIYAVNLLKSGQLPLWNYQIFAGYPLLANFQVGLLNPTIILYFFLSNHSAWSWQIIIQIFLAITFTFLYLRELKLSKISSLLGGIIFAFSGFNLIWLEWDAHTYAAAYLPLLFLLTEKFFKERSLIWGFLISLAIALQIFSGYPQITIYSLLALAMLVLFTKKVWTRKTFFWMIWLGLGFALTSVQLFPAIELLNSSQRQVEGLQKDLAFLPWQNLITFFAPDYFGNHATGNFWGSGNYTNNVGYSGLVPLILSSLSVIFMKKRRVVWLFASLFILSLLLSLPTILAQLLRQAGILGLRAASSTRILFLANFAIACLGAHGFELLLDKKIRFSFLRAVYLPISVLVGVFLGTFVVRQLFARFVNLNSSEVAIKSLQPLLSNLNVALRNLILPLGIVFAVLIIIVFLNFKVKLFKKLCLSSLFCLTVFELFRFGWKYTPFTRSDLVFPETPVISFLKSQPGRFRVAGGDAIPMNMLAPYGLESLGAYDAVYPLRIAEYIAAVNSGSVAAPQGRYGSIDNYSSRLFDLANECYLLSVKRDQQEKPDLYGRSGWKFRLNKFESVFEDKTVVVFKNKSCLPRAFLASGYIVEHDKQRIINQLVQGEFDINRKIILEQDPQITLKDVSEKEKSGQKLEWLSYKPKKEIIKTTSEISTLLFVGDTYYPGWKAFVDGQQTRIYRADYAFRAVFIPNGEHEVCFIYDPLSFKIGLVVSLASLVVLVGTLVYDIKNRHRTSS